jgi:hypothetical protein
MLKLSAITDDKPVKVTLELPAAVHRGLLAMQRFSRGESGQSIIDSPKLIAPMIAKFMTTDRAFARLPGICAT